MEHLKANPAVPADDESPYYSVDPTPALPSSTPTEELKALVLDEKLPMFEVRARPAASSCAPSLRFFLGSCARALQHAHPSPAA